MTGAIRLIKFLATGGVLFFVGYFQIVLFNEVWGFPKIPSQIVSAVICMHLNFLVSELGIWNNQRHNNPHLSNRYTRFARAKIVGVGLNSLIFAAMSQFFSTFESVSVATALVLFYNFFASEKYIYAKVQKRIGRHS